MKSCRFQFEVVDQSKDGWHVSTVQKWSQNIPSAASLHRWRSFGTRTLWSSGWVVQPPMPPAVQSEAELSYQSWGPTHLFIAINNQLKPEWSHKWTQHEMNYLRIWFVFGPSANTDWEGVYDIYCNQPPGGSQDVLVWRLLSIFTYSRRSVRLDEFQII